MLQLSDKESYTDNKFHSGKLSATGLTSSEFDNCIFNSCDFSQKDLDSCKFIDCVFEHCNFSLTKLSATVLNGVRFNNCQLQGVDFTNLAGVTKSFEFAECGLKFSIFRGIDLKGKSFYKCLLNEASFIEMKLEAVDFREADLSGTLFQDCDMRGADFRRAKNYFIDSNKNRIQKAKFSMPEAESLLVNLGIIIE